MKEKIVSPVALLGGRPVMTSAAVFLLVAALSVSRASRISKSAGATFITLFRVPELFFTTGYGE